MRLKVFYILLYMASVGVTNSLGATSDTTVVLNLNHNWYFFDDASKSYLPLIAKGKFSEKTIHFNISPKEYMHTLLRLRSKNEISVFLDNRMIAIIKGQKFFKMDSLVSLQPGGDQELHFTLYGNNIEPETITAHLVAITEGGDELLAEDPIVVRRREVSSFNDFSVGALIILLGLLAAIFTYFPRVFSDFFKASKAFALRESDENLYKTRPLSRVNLLMYLFLSLLIGYILMFVVNQADIFLESGLFYVEGFGDGLWKWAKLSLIILAWFIVKYILITNLSALFHLGGFVVAHYYNYIRMTLIIFITTLVILIFSYFGFEILSGALYHSILDVVLVFMGLRVLILFFKLLTSASYKTLHLFSYLCGTEVIPYVVLLYIGLNQPF